MPFPNVVLRSEQTEGQVSVIDSLMPAGAAGPPLHKHDFDEAFYVIEGDLTFQLEEELVTAGPGEVAFAPRGVPHALANRSDAPARFVIVCTPAGFEREFARRAARQAGVEPPDWAMQPIPEVTRGRPTHGRTLGRAPRLRSVDADKSRLELVEMHIKSRSNRVRTSSFRSCVEGIGRVTRQPIRYTAISHEQYTAAMAADGLPDAREAAASGVWSAR